MAVELHAGVGPDRDHEFELELHVLELLAGIELGVGGAEQHAETGNATQPASLALTRSQQTKQAGVAKVQTLIERRLS